MAWVETRGKRHRGGYRDGTGKKQYTAWGNSKREVRALAQEQEAKIRNGTWVDPSAGKITFATYFEEQWAPNRVMELNTRISYESNYNAGLRETFGDLEVRKITTGVVQRWVARQIKEGVPAGTIAARFKTLQVALAARKGVSAQRDGLIPTNPCLGVTLPPKDPRSITVYSTADSDKIIAALDEWWRPLPLLGAETGMRWGELLGLKVGDFGPDFKDVVIERTIIEGAIAKMGTGTRFAYKHRPKGKKPRRIAMTDDGAKAMKVLVKKRQLFPEDRVFSMPGKGGLPMRTDEWPEGLPISRAFHRQSIWLPAHVGTGVEPLRFHDLRGSHISWLLAGGADITSVMHRVGHTQLATTQVYVDALKDADDRALQALAATRARGLAAGDG